MKQYLDLLQDILYNGEQKDDRTGVGTISVFGRTIRFDLRDSFPAVTTKKLAWKAVVSELLWFLEGSNDERRLCEILYGDPEGKVTIWTPNALAPYWKPKAKFNGDVGRIYGVQWRRWQTTKQTWLRSNESQPVVVDQIAKLVCGLKTDPNGRRHILSAWNPGELDDMALPPCHVMSQYYVSKNKELSCHMYQRSVDSFLGLPFNIASYALLTHMLAQVCNLKVGELIISTGDTHIYLDQVEQVKIQLQRTPSPGPTLSINTDVKNIDDFTMGDFILNDYTSQSALTAKMAV
jgi:thymidylate synthase